MFTKSKLVLLLLFILSLQGCDFYDFKGLVVSSSVTERFRKSTALWPVAAPPVADENEFSFLIITDPHYNNKDPQLFENIEANRFNWGIEFVVITGDMTQSGSQLQYDLLLKDRRRYSGGVYYIPGNHDIYNGNMENYFRNLGPSNYSFTIGKSLFIMIDTANGTLGKQQLQWYEDMLTRTTADNIFVFSHYSLFDEGTQSAFSWPSNEEKYALIAINGRYGVNYFLSGHLHRFRETLVDNVRYIMLNDLMSDYESTILKIAVSGTEISHSLVN